MWTSFTPRSALKLFTKGVKRDPLDLKYLEIFYIRIAKEYFIHLLDKKKLRLQEHPLLFKGEMKFSVKKLTKWDPWYKNKIGWILVW